MSILVTGAAGFIGSHVCERLLGAGEEVVGLDLFDDYYDPRVKEANVSVARQFRAFTLVRGDVREAGCLARLPDHVELVIHLAARAGVRPSIRDPLLYQDVNVGGTAVLLEYMRERGIRQLVFGSSSSVYGNTEKVPFREGDSQDSPISPYAATKKAGELLCHVYHHLYGMGVLCLRLFTVYGPRQRPDLAIHKFARLLRAGRSVPMYGDGTTERDYTYIGDLLQGMEGALRYLRSSPGVYEVINLGESRTVTLRRMIEVLAEALGVEPEMERLPLEPGDVVRTYADISKARRLLRYDPCTSFEEGIARFVEWLEGERTSAARRVAGEGSFLR
ncbi:MAG: GDP-mannose 4,6-dehydratase [Gemmatimonadetes bacterium]|nr:GDP-mannose 4,6-dehydratase [Gemmatimonadota bacterium]